MNKLFDKVYGSLIGSAIGDAMGGPVEGFTFEKIKEKYGIIEDLIDYDSEIIIAPHGPYSLTAGSYTDDSRMSKLFSKAIIKKSGIPTKNDLSKMYCEEFLNAKDLLTKEFLEEYYEKAIYKDDKACFGGQPTNGAIMGIAPFGVISPCNPYKALCDSFDSLFMAEGYARYSTAFAAAAISSAFTPNIALDDILTSSLDAIKKHKALVEGPHWKNSNMYPSVGMKNENLVQECWSIGEKYHDIIKMQKPLRDTVVQQFFADASETLSIAMAFIKASDGNFEKSVIGCTNFGRDNDSTASVAGAITGAYNGASAIPSKWIDLIESNNPKPSFYDLSKDLVKIIESNNKQQFAIADSVNYLINGN
jgi:ADP-ribosylglycohydrolase